MRIVWDEPKRLANLAKHGIDFADIAAKFDFTAAATSLTRERRFRAVGNFRGRVVSVIFGRLGSEAIALISARAASQREKSQLWSSE